MSAPDFAVCADYSNCADGLWKTTAVNWYLSRQLKAEQAVQVRISIYSDNLPIFWKSVQQAFALRDWIFWMDVNARMMWHLRDSS